MLNRHTHSLKVYYYITYSENRIRSFGHLFLQNYNYQLWSNNSNNLNLIVKILNLFFRQVLIFKKKKNHILRINGFSNIAVVFRRIVFYFLAIMSQVETALERMMLNG